MKYIVIEGGIQWGRCGIAAMGRYWNNVYCHKFDSYDEAHNWVREHDSGEFTIVEVMAKFKSETKLVLDKVE